MKHSDELKELMKQINGKEFVFLGKNGLRIDAICLAPPGGKVVSIKPLDSTPEELAKHFLVCGYEHLTLEIVSEMSFCLGNIKVIKEALAPLKFLADMAIGQEIDLRKEADTRGGQAGTSPSCPY